VVACKAHADGDFGVDSRGMDGLVCVLPSDVSEVTPIDLRWRSSLPDLARSVLAVMRALSSRHANPLPFGNDGLLDFGVRDVETVLCGQLDAYSLEALVPANGEGAPLLGAQLEGGENAFPSFAVVDARTKARELRLAANRSASCGRCATAAGPEIPR
jgi:hypothetical protein